MNKTLIHILLLLMAVPGIGYAQKTDAVQTFGNILFLPSAVAFDTLALLKKLQQGDELIWTQPDSAMLLFKQVEVTCKQRGYADGLVKSLMSEAHVLAGQGRFEESYKTYNEADAFCIYCRKKNLTARLYSDWATTYLLQSDYPNAMVYYLKALKEQQANGLGEHPDILFTYANLAYLQSKLGRHQLAIAYLERGEGIARRKHFFGHLSFILNNKGEAYNALNQPYKALKSYEEALSMSEKDSLLSRIQNTEIRQSIYISLGTLMLKQQQQQKAIYYLEKGMALSSRTNPYFTVIFPNYQLGIAHYQLGNYKQAEACLLPALQKANALRFREDMPEAIYTLSAVYEHTGRYKEALQQQKLFMALKDSLMNVEKVKEIRQMELKYLGAQKNKVIAEKKLMISRQHNQLMQKNTWLLICSVTALALLLLCLVMTMRYRSNQHKQRIQAAKIATIEKEMELVEKEKNLLVRDEKLKLMQALMRGEEKERQRLARELHDGLGGMLAAIQMQLSAVQNSADTTDQHQRINKVIDLLKDAARETRETAHNLMPDTLQRHSLKDALLLFCANVNTAGTLNIDLQLHQVSLCLQQPATLCVYRIVQELLQNIIKHAQATEATIQVTQHGSLLYILAEDNGIGFNTHTQSSGIGLRNLEYRVQSLQGSLSIDSCPGRGTISNIVLNLHNLNVLQA